VTTLFVDVRCGELLSGVELDSARQWEHPMQLIATRIYHDFDPKTGREYELRDRMLRKACASFVLMVAGELPGDPEVEKSYSLAASFEWLRECPWQIERAVVLGR
jgi:hypothetical protein